MPVPKTAGVCACLLIAAAANGTENSGTEIALKPYIAGLRVVEMRVEERKGQFIFDSAGGLSLVTPEFSRAVGLQPFGRLTAFRHTGERMDFQRVPVRAVSIGGVKLPQRELALFDLMQLLEGAPVVQGLVALNSFEGAALTIDFARNRLILESSQSLRARTRKMQPLRIRAARQSGGAALDVFVAVDSPQGPLWLELDSGNAQPVLLAPHAAEQLGLKLTSEPTAAVLRLSAGTDYPCTVASKEMIADGLLNAVFFQKHIITLDLKNIRAWIRRNEESTEGKSSRSPVPPFDEQEKQAAPLQSEN